MISLSLAPGYTGIAVAKTAPFMGLSPREQAIPSRIRRRPRWVLDILLPRDAGRRRGRARPSAGTGAVAGSAPRTDRCGGVAGGDHGRIHDHHVPAARLLVRGLTPGQSRAAA